MCVFTVNKCDWLEENGMFGIAGVFLPPANEVWGNGDIFTSMCQEFCSQGRCLLWDGDVCLPWGVPAPGGCLVPGRSGPRGCLFLVETPPGQLLLRAVCILLECILVLIKFIPCKSPKIENADAVNFLPC